MTRDEAVEFLRVQVERAEPPVPCPVCVTRMFPRMGPKSQGSTEWRPGLRMTAEWGEWFGVALGWDPRQHVGDIPAKPLSPFYETCTDCGGTGVAAQGSGPWHSCLEALGAR